MPWPLVELPLLCAAPAGGLPPHADEMGVFDAAVAAGEVVGVKLIRRKRDRGDCRGYGGERCRPAALICPPCTAPRNARLVCCSLALLLRLLLMLVPAPTWPAACIWSLATACQLSDVAPAGCHLARGRLLPMPHRAAGFVRVANQEAAEAICQTVKEVGC